MSVTITKSSEGKAFLDALKKMKDATAKIGWFEGDKYPDGTPVAYVAAIQEHGSPKNNIPMRAFMRPTLIEKKVEYSDIRKRGLQSIIKGKETIGTALEKIAGGMAGDFRQAISKITTPPLKESTIKHRQNRKSPPPNTSTKPLSDTRHMMETLTHVVTEK